MFVFARALALFPRPGTGNANTTTGPISAPSAGGFYGSLLENRKWWGNELESEGMMALSLPSRATKTNGTYLLNQMQHQLIMGMITWHDTCVDASARLTNPLFRRLRGCFSVSSDTFSSSSACALPPTAAAASVRARRPY